MRVMVSPAVYVPQRYDERSAKRAFARSGRAGRRTRGAAPDAATLCLRLAPSPSLHQRFEALGPSYSSSFPSCSEYAALPPLRHLPPTDGLRAQCLYSTPSSPRATRSSSSSTMPPHPAGSRTRRVRPPACRSPPFILAADVPRSNADDPVQDRPERLQAHLRRRLDPDPLPEAQRCRCACRR